MVFRQARRALPPCPFSSGTKFLRPGTCPRRLVTTNPPLVTCACPPGTTNPPLGTCGYLSGTASPPPGTAKLPQGTCPRWLVTMNPPLGTCACPPGTTNPPLGTCARPPGTTSPPLGTCACPPGTTKLPLGTCACLSLRARGRRNRPKESPLRLLEAGTGRRSRSIAFMAKSSHAGPGCSRQVTLTLPGTLNAAALLHIALQMTQHLRRSERLALRSLDEHFQRQHFQTRVQVVELLPTHLATLRLPGLLRPRPGIHTTNEVQHQLIHLSPVSLSPLRLRLRCRLPVQSSRLAPRGRSGRRFGTAHGRQQ